MKAAKQQLDWRARALEEFAAARAELQRPTAITIAAERALLEALDVVHAQIATVRSERAAELRKEARDRQDAETKARVAREAAEQKDRAAVKKLLEAELERRRLIKTFFDPQKA